MNIYCPNCENECSEKAPVCPKCGHPLVGRKARGLLKVCVGVGVGVALAYCGTLLRGGERETGAEDIAVARDTPATMERVEALELRLDELAAKLDSERVVTGSQGAQGDVSAETLGVAMAKAVDALPPCSEEYGTRWGNLDTVYRELLRDGVRVVSGKLRETSVRFAKALPERLRNQWLLEAMESVAAYAPARKLRKNLLKRGCSETDADKLMGSSYSLEAIYNLATDERVRSRALRRWEAWRTELYNAQVQAHEWRKQQALRSARGGSIGRGDLRTPVLAEMPIWNLKKY